LPTSITKAAASGVVLTWWVNGVFSKAIRTPADLASSASRSNPSHSTAYSTRDTDVVDTQDRRRLEQVCAHPVRVNPNPTYPAATASMRVRIGTRL